MTYSVHTSGVEEAHTPEVREVSNCVSHVHRFIPVLKAQGIRLSCNKLAAVYLESSRESRQL